MAFAGIHSEVGGLDISGKNVCLIETKKRLGCVAQFGRNGPNEENRQKALILNMTFVL